MSDFSGMTSLNPGYRALVLGAVVLARDGAQDLAGHFAGLHDQWLEAFGSVEVNHSSKPPSMRATARRSRYQRSK